MLADGRAQEEKGGPSQKIKEAVEKFKEAPEVAGKGLKKLIDSGKEKLRETFGRKTATKAEGDSLTLPKKTERPQATRYSPVGQRDPFRPPAKATVSARPREELSPLERYELGQLKLTGVVWNIKEPRAMVEDAAGLGYIVKVGTPMGPNEGRIKTIKPNEVVIEESYVDYYGARKKREVRMRLSSD